MQKGNKLTKTLRELRKARRTIQKQLQERETRRNARRKKND